MNIYTEYQTERGFTAAQAAASLDVPVSTWRKWTAETRKPRPMAARVVREALENWRAVQKLIKGTP